MKKVLCILAAALMVFCLVACGDNIPKEEIKKELCGPWGTSFTNALGDEIYTFYIFSDDDTVQYVYDGLVYSEMTGTYTIEKDVIKCSWKDGKNTSSLKYTFKDGTLTLKADEGGELMKIN